MGICCIQHDFFVCSVLSGLSIRSVGTYIAPFNYLTKSFTLRNYGPSFGEEETAVGSWVSPI